MCYLQLTLSLRDFFARRKPRRGISISNCETSHIIRVAQRLQRDACCLPALFLRESWMSHPMLTSKANLACLPAPLSPSRKRKSYSGISAIGFAVFHQKRRNALILGIPEETLCQSNL
ncbi:hypothetical protein AOQ84DRAFT_86086 [Glonium stellatum]|uniref:Uncharacterized protein n=1 Tax=Glonium stellatum TaxID=574774 RepID=A0A8E2EWA9_9PEZI|nr:hypothetical protein AOQ84DRAFT_86086 [Glonium stellatum]